MRIALVTCPNLPDWEVDDRPFHDALRERGVELRHPSWDNASFNWSGCDAALIRTTWDYQDRHEAFLDWARRVDRVTRLFNPLPIIEWNSVKTYLRDLQQRGAPTIPTEWLERGAPVDLRSRLAMRGWDRAFLKPAIGATARETLRFNVDDEGLARADAQLARLLPSETMLLQPYLPRVESVGELSLIFIDGAFSHAVRKAPVPGDYRVQNDFGAHDEPAPVSPETIELARGVLESVRRDLLYGRADFLRDHAGGLCLSELELIEPSLFFRHDPAAAERLADALIRRVRG
jgi:glutathione synthase/RimK-type ligase-like ATP-grasp enzyme